MDTQQLLTTPASRLTRKQRRDRAAIKRKMADEFRVGTSYRLDGGSIRLVEPGATPRPGHVIVQLGGRPLRPLGTYDR